jgi:hypothetical protein
MKQHTTKQAIERTPIRERWTAQVPGSRDEAHAGSLLRAASATKPFGAREIAEVGARLHGKERFRPRPLAWQLALGAALVLFGGALSASVSQVLRIASAPTREPETPVPAAASARRGSLGTTRPAGQTPPPAPAILPSPEPAPEQVAPSMVARPAVARAVRSVAMREEPRPDKPDLEKPASPLEPQVMPPPLPGASALAKESRLLTRAIAKLRQDGDAEQALTILEQHRSEFGARGALAPEANATRIEALLRLGRHTQALALLDAMAPATNGVGREMLVARAELRADKSRRTAALHDFDLLLTTGGKTDSVTERALYGRATCRGKIGDGEGARRDLETYLATFPEGRFAHEARAALNFDLH